MAVMEINEKTNQGRIQGFCHAEFEAVKNAFLSNFNERSEVGASLCIRVGDEIKVDLWGGLTSEEIQTPWEEDTVSVVFSCTKAAVALCAHILIDRGDMDLFTPVTDYWPEFGKNSIKAPPAPDM